MEERATGFENPISTADTVHPPHHPSHHTTPFTPGESGEVGEDIGIFCFFGTKWSRFWWCSGEHYIYSSPEHLDLHTQSDSGQIGILLSWNIRFILNGCLKPITYPSLVCGVSHHVSQSHTALGFISYIKYTYILNASIHLSAAWL